MCTPKSVSYYGRSNRTHSTHVRSQSTQWVKVIENIQPSKQQKKKPTDHERQDYKSQWVLAQDH